MPGSWAAPLRLLGDFCFEWKATNGPTLRVCYDRKGCGWAWRSRDRKLRGNQGCATDGRPVEGEAVGFPLTAYSLLPTTLGRTPAIFLHTSYVLLLAVSRPIWPFIGQPGRNPALSAGGLSARKRRDAHSDSGLHFATLVKSSRNRIRQTAAGFAFRQWT